MRTKKITLLYIVFIIGGYQTILAQGPPPPPPPPGLPIDNGLILLIIGAMILGILNIIGGQKHKKNTSI